MYHFNVSVLFTVSIISHPFWCDIPLRRKGMRERAQVREAAADGGKNRVNSDFIMWFTVCTKPGSSHVVLMLSYNSYVS